MNLTAWSIYINGDFDEHPKNSPVKSSYGYIWLSLASKSTGSTAVTMGTHLDWFSKISNFRWVENHLKTIFSQCH